MIHQDKKSRLLDMITLSYKILSSSHIFIQTLKLKEEFKASVTRPFLVGFMACHFLLGYFMPKSVQ